MGQLVVWLIVGAFAFLLVKLMWPLAVLFVVHKEDEGDRQADADANGPLHVLLPGNQPQDKPHHD
jgi:hypothetical protein